MRGGVSVSAGRYDGDTIDDIIVAGGRRAGSQIEVHSGRVTSGEARILARQFAFAALATANLPTYAVGMSTTTDGRIGSLAATQGAGPGNGVRELPLSGDTFSAISGADGPLRIAATRVPVR